MQEINYKFKNKELLDLAFTHSSYGAENNERLEFLGDRVLGLVMSDILYGLNISEGEMTKALSNLVCGECLSKKIDTLDIVKHIKVGDNFDKKKDLSEKVKAGLFEAIAGAVYLDGGLDAGREFIENVFDKKEIRKAVNVDLDYKTQLQERLQQKGYEVGDWEYRSSKKESGFLVKFLLKDRNVASGEGAKIKEAEQAAAKKALMDIL